MALAPTDEELVAIMTCVKEWMLSGERTDDITELQEALRRGGSLTLKNPLVHAKIVKTREGWEFRVQGIVNETVRYSNLMDALDKWNSWLRERGWS